jgi:hypothetical protein
LKKGSIADQTSHSLKKMILQALSSVTSSISSLSNFSTTLPLLHLLQLPFPSQNLPLLSNSDVLIEATVENQ